MSGASPSAPRTGSAKRWDPSEQAGIAASAAIDVRYGKPLDPTETALTGMLRQSEVLERLARYMQTQFAFPEPITIRLTHCRAPNAYWEEDYREVVLCFELMTALLKIAKQPEVAAAVRTLPHPAMRA